MATKIEAYGKLYTGSDVRVGFLNHQNPELVSKLKYGTKQEKSNVYGLSTREPVGRIRKQKVYEASITMKAPLYDAIEAAVPNKSDGIEGIAPFPVTAAYMDDAEQIIKRVKLVYCEFTGNVTEVTNDNNEIEYECELAIGGIERL